MQAQSQELIPSVISQEDRPGSAIFGLSLEHKCSLGSRHARERIRFIAGTAPTLVHILLQSSAATANPVTSHVTIRPPCLESKVKELLVFLMFVIDTILIRVTFYPMQIDNF